MPQKSSRLDLLKTIISNKEIGSQEELLRELKREGFSLAQATLSRDLKLLKVAKTVNAQGNYVYTLPSDTARYRRTPDTRVVPDFLVNTGFRSITFSGNLAVIHTRPGYAGGLASEIDSRQVDSVIGTIAGDDTILLILREGTLRGELVAALKTFIPHMDQIPY